jgi:hypothetical protein
MIAQAKTAASLGIASQEGPASQAAARSSRRSRKPAAPQWVNPHWQQTSAVRERVESEDGRDSSEERDKKKAKHFSSLHHRSVDANLNNFVESDAPAAGGRDSSAERPSVRATVDDDDDDKYDNDEEEDEEDEEESPKRLTIHRPRAGSLSPSRRASPSPSPSSDEDKMDDESEAKDDDNNEQS